MPKLNISLAQMVITPGNPRRNTEVMHDLAAEAARRGSQILVLPELWPTGPALDRAQDLAAALNAGVFADTSTAAKQHNLCIVGSMLEKRGVGVTNTAAFFAPNGNLVGVYRKIHLFGPMGEDRYLNPGQSVLNMDLPWGKTGLAICYDLRFPEMFRRYGVEGARLVIIPAAWPAARLAHWRALLIARAIENQYFVLACNCVGEATTAEGQTVFAGHSMIVDPWGEIVIEGGSSPALLTTEIELDLVEQTRELIPVFQDRRPEVYGLDG